MKKLNALLLSSMLLVTSVPTNTLAANITAAKEETIAVALEPATSADLIYDILPRDTKGTTTEPTNEALENAIKTVKGKINIPSDYTEFEYYFYNTNSYADSYWSLSWGNPKTDNRIQVNCDQSNHITYYYIYNRSEEKSGIPNYLKKELKSTADEFIKKIAPEVSGNLEFVEADYEGIYSGNYVYSYQRIQNGVVFPDNTVSVSVNSITGEVKAASFNWLYETKIPSSEVKLTKDEASKLMKENMKMNLVYRSDYYHIFKDGNNTSQKAYLVYEPSIDYISVDAKTGEVYLTRTEWEERNITGEAADSASEEGSKADGGYLQLTDEEISKINDLKNLISKEEAIKLVTGNKALYLDNNLKSFTATLSKTSDDNGKDSYVWNVELSDPREIDYEKDTDYYRAYASAQVDAKSGKILSFNASVKSYYDEKNGKWTTVKIPYDKETSREILEKFLNNQIKNRFDNSKLVEESDDYIAYFSKEIPVYGGYNYQYNRVNEGIEYPYNSIRGSVDGVTGKIYSFNSNWDNNIVFEAPNGIITADEAMDKYLSKDGYGLKYEINVIQSYDPDDKPTDTPVEYAENFSVRYETRLVYRADVSPSFISPFTGEQLMSNGEVYKETKPYSYLDITDTKENRAIMLLSDMNIGFEGEYFNPDQEITIGELNEVLLKVGYGYDAEQDANANKPITKEELAQSFITKLGLDKISGIKDIYQTGFADEKNISSKYLGAVALAKGLGLMEADSNNMYYPSNKVTRVEAVHLILKFIDVQRNKEMY